MRVEPPIPADVLGAVRAPFLALAAGVADNKTWREERPGQVTAPRAALVATVRAIVERAR